MIRLNVFIKVSDANKAEVEKIAKELVEAITERQRMHSI